MPDDGLPGDPRSAEAPGRTFGDYELLAVIARGGMGVVYRARQRSLGRLVALKLIRAGEFADEAGRKRFRAEAEAAAHLDHPNIVPVYEVGEHAGQAYFAMKLIEGGSLAEQMRDAERGARNEPGALSLAANPHSAFRIPHFIKVARAVHHAHQRGVLHRDLKPSNLLLDAHGEPFVSDFGLAKRLESGPDLTLSGAVLGTPNYMSPEQAAGRTREITTATDIFSLGAILYELLAGRPPFQADTPLATMRKVVEEEPAPLAIANRRLEIPRDLSVICLKCLQKNPAHRYATAEALAEDLERWLRHEPIRARPSTASERAVKWARRHPARAGLLAVSAAAAVALMVLDLAYRRTLQGERDHAVQLGQQASAAATRAEAGELAARERAYAADLYAASQALAVNELAQARRLLDEHRPKETANGEWRMANDEWRMTNGVVSPSLRSRRGHEAEAAKTQGPSLTNAAVRLVTSAATSPDLRGFEWRALWERSRGQEAFAFTNLARPAACLVFAPDGRTLVSGGDDGVHLWDVAERRPLGLFPGPAPGPTSGDQAPTDAELRPLLEASPAVADFLKVQPGIRDYLDALGHTGRTRLVNSVAFTPDGKHLLVGSRDFVRSWTFATGAFDFAVPEDNSRASTPRTGDLFVVANNLEAASGDERRTAHPQSALVYSYSRRRLVAELPGYGQQAAISPDGEHVAAFSRTLGAVVWNPLTGGTSQISRQVGDYLFSFSPDGRTLFVATDEGRMLWDLRAKTGRTTLIDEHRIVSAVAWSPDGRLFATSGEDNSIAIWTMPPDSWATHWQRETLRGHQVTVRALAFSADGRWLASAGNDRSIRLWDIVKTLAPTAASSTPLTFLDHNCGPPMDSAASYIIGRDHHVSNGGLGGEMTITGVQLGSPRLSLPGTAHQFFAGHLAAGLGFVTVELGTNDVPVQFEIRRLPDGAVQTRRWFLSVPDGPRHEDSPRYTHAAAGPDGRWLALTQTDGKLVRNLQVYDLRTGQFVTQLPGVPHSSQTYLRASPDSRWLVRLDYVGGDNWITIYDSRTWNPSREICFRGTGEDVLFATIDPTSRRMATGGRDASSLRIWDLLTGRLEAQCASGNFASNPVWSPDGRTLVVNDRRLLRFWSMVAFRELATISHSAFSFNQPVGFTPDGRSLVTLYQERVETWSPATPAALDLPP